MAHDLPRFGIGMVGHAFMGAAHAQGWRNAPRFFSLPYALDLAALCGRNADTARQSAERYGFGAVETDYRSLVTRSDVDLVDVCTPGDTHAEISIAALEAGKHVLCEKPLANTVAEAEAMADAAAAAREKHGVFAMTGFTYRRVPAIQLARKLVAEGKIGQIHHVRAQYLQDWIIDPEAPLSWRLQKDRAGSGALGDIGAHIVDAAQFIAGQRIESVSGLLHTFVTKRPVLASGSGLSGKAGEGYGDVTVDDCALFTARFDGGAIGSFEATRFAGGRKNGLRIEINGSAGSIAFDLENLNWLEFFDGTEDSAIGGFRKILVTEPVHPYISAWWPAGHTIGWEHSFTHQVYDLLTAIHDGTQPLPSFADGLQVQRVLAAVEASSGAGSVMTPIG